jgi:carbon storage regulator
MIGDVITVWILAIQGTKVRIGIDAPRSIAVHRRKVYDAMKRDREGEDPDDLGSVMAPSGTPSTPKSPTGSLQKDVHEAIQVIYRYCMVAQPQEHSGLLDELSGVVELLRSRSIQTAS